MASRSKRYGGNGGWAAGLSLASAWDDLRADYDASRESRFRKRLTGVNPSGSGADYHFRNEHSFYKTIEQARDFDRNDIVIGQCITRLVDNVIQDGIKYDPLTGDDELNLMLATRWEEWGDDPVACHNEGELCFNDISRLVYRSVVVDGDIVPTPVDGGALQVIEAHRIKTPQGTKRNVVLGVLMSANRKRLEYWVTKEDISPMQSVKLVNDIVPMPVWDGDEKILFHVYDPKRVSQTRGVSALAPVFDMVGMHADVQFAAVIAVQSQTCFAVLEEREFKDGATYVPSAATGGQTTDTDDDGGVRTLENIGPGMRITSQPGAKLKGFSPTIPGPQFGEHTKLILTFLGINLGMPVVMLLLDPSETNFSGWRGAVDQARIGFMAQQRMMINRFYRPVLRWKIREWLSSDREIRRLASKPGVNVFSHKWNPPRWRYIEPVKDAQGAVLRIENRLDSQRQVLAESGTDIDDLQPVVINDNGRWIELAIEKAKELEAAHNVRVDWREVLNVPGPISPIGITPEAELEIEKKQAKTATQNPSREKTDDN